MKIEPERIQILLKTARAVSIVSAMFAAVLSVLIIANYTQLATSNPLDSPALAKLFEKLKANKDDEELKAQIRELDLIARKAFFTKQWQINAGGVMLLITAIVLIASLRLASYFRKDKPARRPARTADAYEKGMKIKRLSIVILIVVLYSTSIIVGYASYVLLDEKKLNERLSGMQKGVAGNGSENSVSEGDIYKNWASFRGPFSQGRTDDADATFTQDYIHKLAVIWKTQAPINGFNSPVVWNDRLFMTGGDKQSTEIYCFDAASGAILWTRQLEKIIGRPPVMPGKEPDAGYAAPTPATDGNRIFAIFASGDLVSLDFEGTEVWKKNLGVPDNGYGHASSLLCYGKYLLVQFDNFTDSKLFALDTLTGRSIWEKKRDVLASWSSPVIARVDTRIEIITNGNPYVVAYELAEGDQLWSTECMTGDVATSPAYSDGIVFVAEKYARLAAIDNATGGILWENYDDLPVVASPVANDEYLFTATDYGVVTCLDSKKGAVYWTHEFKNGFYSSPVIKGGLLFLTDLEGTLHIVSMEKVFKEIKNIELKERTVSTPAIVQGKIYIRGESNLYCISSPLKESE